MRPVSSLVASCALLTAFGVAAQTPPDAAAPPPAAVETPPASPAAPAAPAPEAATPAPTPEAPAAPAEATPAPEAPPAPVAPAAPVGPSPEALRAYAAECWRVDRPVEDSPLMVPPGEHEAHLLQKGYGSLSRRAVYNAEGLDNRLTQAAADQDKTWMKLRLKHQVLPVVAAVVLFGSTLVLASAGTTSLALWLLRLGPAEPNNLPKNLPLGIQREVISYLILVTAVTGLPFAVMALVAGVFPVVMGIWKTVQLTGLPQNFLLDGDGFSNAEADQLAADHNKKLAARVGLAEAGQCNAR